MSIGIGNEHEVLRVTPDGQFIWHPDADRMIEEGNFNFNPAMPHILRALRKREWVGLTDKEAMQICEDCGCLSEDWLVLLDAIEAKLKEKNT